MLSNGRARSTPAKITVALLLTFAAGLIDIVGFILFWQVFTAHMTGNTAHLAMSLIARHWTDAAKTGLVIPVFLAGAVIGRAVIELCARMRWRRAASLVFFLEAVALSEIIWLNDVGRDKDATWISLLLLTLTMGLQTAALTRIGPLTVHTTFVTGMLNSLGERLANVLFWAYDAVTAGDRRTAADFWQSRAVRESSLLFAVWCAYAIGGGAGAIAGSHWNASSLFIPLGILFAAIVIDQVSPLTLEEEEDEAKKEIPLREKPGRGSI